ncbi:hypothetical protein LSH36_180g03014 [Paralvinella palmiformis]|uniref:Glycine amidinotransferase n=1 Tax=Paralvinella palmiformis TaxID=53620 RepID=A0AAD9JRR2_9ANNE|nr:hypothetical protein LSH36_180g03014 [Paralvinella palmiformis]
MHHVVKSLLRHARRSKSASARSINPRGFASLVTRSTSPSNRPASTQARVAAEDPLPVQSECPVSSYNEWDPLEEVIVGRAGGHRIPSLHSQIQAVTRPESWDNSRKLVGKSPDPELISKADKEANELVRVLEAEGITVKRPEEFAWDEMGTFRTPYFEEGGYKNTCPRDGILVIGDEIIEAAMGMRARLFEFHPYRKLLNDYFRQGATWTAAPRPTMHDDLYRKDFPLDDFDKQMEMLKEGKFILTESEMVFDAADVIRFGRDIFVTLTHTTNRGGVEWLRRHLGPKGYRVHSLLFFGTQNCHADATLMPLRPGLLIVAGERPCLKVDDQPIGWEYFEERGWEVVQVPLPNYVETVEPNKSSSDDGVARALRCKPSGSGLEFGSHLCVSMKDVSRWLHINMLSLDSERVICQKNEPLLHGMLTKRGIKPIELDMSHCFYLGGAFHCWTTDIRRRGQLQDYGLN